MERGNFGKEPLYLFNPDYIGQVYDYQDLVDKAEKFERPSYPVFRGVCPGWDNEARRPGQGKTVLNSSPQSYRRYLEAVISEAQSCNSRDDEPLVFINAWNEWAEGAHLEPDRRYGMAFLEATRIALLRASLRRMSPAVQGRIAVVIHAFYPEIFAEILDELKGIKQEHHFFVSTEPGKEAVIRDILRTGELRRMSSPAKIEEGISRRFYIFCERYHQQDTLFCLSFIQSSPRTSKMERFGGDRFYLRSVQQKASTTA